MAITSTKSYINKVKDVRIVSGTFQNDDGKEQSYKSVQIIVSSDGEDEALSLSGASATKPSALMLALKGADDIRNESYAGGKTILDEENN